MPWSVGAHDQRQVWLLTEAFARVFGIQNPRPFGGATSRHQGVSDDARGVQWNAGVDRERGVATVGVNLEGMKYDDWPIATFIERELQRPCFPTCIATLPDPGGAELWWSRDAWQGAGARPPIRESNIGPEPPVLLDRLDEDLWRSMLVEAYDCLDPERGHRGRATQVVTLVRAGQKLKEVSPHLQIKRVAWRLPPASVGDAVAALARSRALLEGVYAFVRGRVG